MTTDLITNTVKCLQISPVQVFISDTQWQLISPLIQENVSKYLHFRYSFLIHNDNWSYHQYREMSTNISSSGIHFWYTMTIDLITNTGKCLQISPLQVSISDTQWQVITHHKHREIQRMEEQMPKDVVGYLLMDWRWLFVLQCWDETGQEDREHHVDHGDQTVVFSFTQPVTNTTSRGRTEPWGFNTLWTNARDDRRRTGD